MKTKINFTSFGRSAKTGTIEGKFNVRVPWLDGKIGEFDYENAVITIDPAELKDAVYREQVRKIEDIFHGMDGINIDGTVVIAERSYFTNGELYRVRDTLPEAGSARIQCEYATKDDEGTDIWTPCEEACDFAEIEPYMTGLDAVYDRAGRQKH
ncbi:hypothetical protein [Neorhizobium alkalisoli]|uniref:Uncharacterized protein n=1 Tax=Neorhizobium alkalisoli TaxID=528178 RepID=A0A561R1A6_9HYPH|nr:hypothetical protein [Neorhizobium alkalisoli]TWF56379.1 hypothetical protein FHW37_1025 [Neorhizobium alkalisoli]